LRPWTGGPDWFNHRRLLEPIGDIPPVEKENAYYQETGSALAA
jgi:transposase InsO family protein